MDLRHRARVRARNHAPTIKLATLTHTISTPCLAIAALTFSLLVLPKKSSSPGPPLPFEVASTPWLTVAVFRILPVVVGKVKVESSGGGVASVRASGVKKTKAKPGAGTVTGHDPYKWEILVNF
jgi:hypothetical protein